MIFLQALVWDKMNQLTEKSIDRILAAKDAEVNTVLRAKEAELAAYVEMVEDLKEEVKHERARAEKAIDSLLAKSESAPVRHADLERAAAGAGIGKPEDPIFKERQTQLAKIFSQVNGVGEDDGEKEDPMMRLVSIGGQPVEN